MNSEIYKLISELSEAWCVLFCFVITLRGIILKDRKW